jgi:pilus assembly protein Flp/PilA
MFFEGEKLAMFTLVNSAIVALQIRTAGRQEGQAMIEYGLIAGLVSIAAVVALTAVGGDVSRIFTAVENALTPVLPG